MPNTPPPPVRDEQNGVQKLILICGGLYLGLLTLGWYEQNWSNSGAFIVAVNALLVYAAWLFAGNFVRIASSLPGWIGYSFQWCLEYQDAFHRKRRASVRPDMFFLKRWLLNLHVIWIICAAILVHHVLKKTSDYLVTKILTYAYENEIGSSLPPELAIPVLLQHYAMIIFSGWTLLGFTALWFFAGGIPDLKFKMKKAGEEAAADFSYDHGRFDENYERRKQEEEERRRQEEEERKRQQEEARRKEEAERNRKQKEKQGSQGQNQGNNQGQGKQNQGRTAKGPEMPYGVDKRHPADVKLWAIVDDPNASEGEQLNALRMIQKRRKDRENKTDNVKKQDEAADALKEVLKGGKKKRN